MNNYQSYKDYKNSGRRTAGPREGSSPEVKRKPVKKTKASVSSKARPSKKDTAAERTSSSQGGLREKKSQNSEGMQSKATESRS